MVPTTHPSFSRYEGGFPSHHCCSLLIDLGCTAAQVHFDLFDHLFFREWSFVIEIKITVLTKTDSLLELRMG
jgi:hypothetical protein